LFAQLLDVIGLLELKPNSVMTRPEKSLHVSAENPAMGLQRY